MILAAGLGNRMKPLTDNCPKALLKLNGKPLLEHVILRLITFGYEEFIINVHHFSEQIIDFIKVKNSFGKKIEFSDESDMLLETGGGLLKASWFFNDNKPFLVCNADIISDINLALLRKFHDQEKALATLAVRHRVTSRYFIFDQQKIFVGWKNTQTGEIKSPFEITEKPEEIAFSGIQIINPAIFNLILEKGRFSLTDLYIRLCGKQCIKGFVHDEGFWFDVGKQGELERASLLLNKIDNKYEE